MKAFEFDHHLINSYARFSRSFSTVRPEDLKSEIDRQYDAGRFWPDALLSLNPRFLKGDTVDDLVASGDLDDATGQIFRFGDKPLRFHRHQAQSIAKARAGQSYVVTTGTGSGKSLCFFVPVVDAIIRRRKAGKPRGAIAIIVYPMNALANSQIKEIEGFISPSGLAGGHLIRFARGSEYGSDLLACHFQRPLWHSAQSGRKLRRPVPHLGRPCCLGRVY
jgi:ATP-dependent helicase YprA (DUF1998 family)